MTSICQSYNQKRRAYSVQYKLQSRLLMNTIYSYMQDNPNSLDPFPPNAAYTDPDFSNCFQAICYKTYGLRIANSNNVLNYGAGLYSFFNNERDSFYLHFKLQG